MSDSERIRKRLPDYFDLLKMPWHLAAGLMGHFFDDDEEYLGMPGPHARNLFHVAKALQEELAARDEAIVKPWREAVEESERVLEVVNDVLDKKGYQRMVSIDMTIGKLRALLTVKEAS